MKGVKEEYERSKGVRREGVKEECERSEGARREGVRKNALPVPCGTGAYGPLGQSGQSVP